MGGGKFMPGLFGNLFDLNHDGKMDSFEKAAEFATFMSIMDEEEKEQKRKQKLQDDYDFSDDEEDDSF